MWEKSKDGEQGNENAATGERVICNFFIGRWLQATQITVTRHTVKVTEIHFLKPLWCTLNIQKMCLLPLVYHHHTPVTVGTRYARKVDHTVSHEKSESMNNREQLSNEQ